jgi:hypothetical protein
MDAMKTPSRLRVCLQTGELEVEGSESFVSSYADEFRALIAKLAATKVVSTPGPLKDQRLAVASAASADAQEFPELLHQMSSSSGTDQILLAGAFAGRGREDGTFATSEANALLVEQGVKLANASQSMANNLKAKRVFKVGKNWKVSKTGQDYLKGLT